MTLIEASLARPTAFVESLMLSQQITLSSEALFQDISGEGVILDLASSSYFGLDGVGVRFWQLLQTDTSLESACQQLLKEYDVSREQLEQDLLALVNQLAEAGLVTVV
ncbi:MAG: PqqD family protein [Porticoccaceae bacterium]|nr:PqqD family protein [Porticoccaceae bacterium]